jgi:chromosome segregation ATPase
MRKHLATMIVAGATVLGGLAGTSLELRAQTAPQQSETDRLRDALRSATSTVRSLEDERTAAQAKLAEAQRERDALKKEVKAAQAKVKEVERDYRQAVTDFNDRLEEAATVARGKDAERAKAAAEAVDYKARTNACIQKNQELVKIGRDLLDRYEGVTFGDKVKAREPITAIGRVQMQMVLQTYGDKILNQKIQP